MKKAKVVIKKNEKKKYRHLVEAGIDPMVACLMHRRGINEINDAKKYLYGNKNDFHDPSLIRNIDKVGNLIQEAISKKERITIYGDYDADGCTSVAILYSTLKDLKADVKYRLPDRLSEGYGMSTKGVQDIFADGGKLIITVDNGIRNATEIEFAKSLGMKVIVTDHHKFEEEPPADAVVNLHGEHETYPFTELSGAGLAFKISCYLYELYGYKKEEGYKYLDLAAISTVADVVNLVGENRIIVNEGLKYINSRGYDRAGIKELIQLYAIEDDLVSSDIGFKIAPIINASGRLCPNGAEKSLELLIERDEAKIKAIASQLFQINEERKLITKESLNAAYSYIEEEGLENDMVLVLFVANIPEGIVGLVSGRITEKYNRPSIVFTEGTHFYKASARSPASFDLYKALQYCDEFFVKYGGHPQAAGMSIEKDLNIIKALRKKINKYAKDIRFDDQRITHVDFVLEDKEIIMGLYEKLKILEPYGAGNERPVFMTKDYAAKKKKGDDGWVKYMYLGAEKEHIKFQGVDSEAIGFYRADEFEELGKPSNIDLCFRLSLNTFMGNKKLQLEIVELMKNDDEGKAKVTDLMLEMSKSMELLTKV